MIYHTYGQTGIDLSCIGFGGMRFDSAQPLDERAELVAKAHQHGINYFDTAPGYPESETVFGIAFKNMKQARGRPPFYVSTKSMSRTPDGIRRDLETSLERMGLEKIDFFHLWCVMSLDDYHKRAQNGVLRMFENLKREGLIQHICVSTHMNGDDIDTLLQRYPFDGVLLGYSVMNFAYRTAGLNAAARMKQGVVVMNPLGGGVIPKNPDRFRFVTTSPEESVTEGALRFLMNDPRITLSLVGINNEKELEEALKAVDGFQPIPDEQISTIQGGLSKAMDTLCTGCRYCDSCPEGVFVPGMMDAYNQFLLTHKSQSMLDQLKWHWGLNLIERDLFNRCTQCGRCEDLCTQHLPIRNRLKDIDHKVSQYRNTLSRRVVWRHEAKSFLKKIKKRIENI